MTKTIITPSTYNIINVEYLDPVDATCRVKTDLLTLKRGR